MSLAHVVPDAVCRPIAIEARLVLEVECVGYIGRAMGAHETPYWTMAVYILQSLCILLAPAFFAASIYMSLGRIIHLLDGESHSPVRRTWLTKIFVSGDVLSFLTQSTGERARIFKSIILLLFTRRLR